MGTGERIHTALSILYSTCRLTFLFLTIAFGVCWAYFGWDSTFLSTYGTGYHYSTFQTFTGAFYLMLVYFQEGSLRNIKNDVLHDLRGLSHFWRYEPGDMRHFAVDDIYGVCFIFFVTVGAMMLFEFVWVFAYDWFGFGSLFWPVYFAPNILLRDVGVTVLCVAFAPVTLWLIRRTHPSFRFRWRFTAPWVLMVFLTLSVWGLWLSGSVPHQVVTFSTLSPSAVITPHGLPANYSQSSYVFPAQRFFPQTEYTFYPSYMLDRPYNASNILGFYVNNPGVHLVNVLAKDLTYLAVCYPAMLIVKRKER